MTRAMHREMMEAQARAARVHQSQQRATGRMQRARRWIKRYRPTDRTKRHRLEDDQPKEEEVTSYTRRKA